MKTFPGTGTFFPIIIVLSQFPLNFAQCYLEFPLLFQDNVFEYYGYQSRLEEECPGITSCSPFNVSSWSGDNDQEFIDACNNDGGKVLEADYTWTCYHIFDRYGASWRMITSNWKRCIGVSCTSIDEAGAVEYIASGSNCSDILCTGFPVPGSDLVTPFPGSVLDAPASGSNACSSGNFLAVLHLITFVLCYAIGG